MEQNHESTRQAPGVRRALWLATTPSTHYPQLAEEIHVDVAIVGAGIAGLTTAFLLKQRGLKMAVLESNGVAAGVTAHSTAKLTSLHTLTYADLAERKGSDAARTYAAANEAAIRKVEELVGELDIECDFTRTPAYTFTQSADESDRVRQEAQAAREAGLAAHFVTETPLPFAVEAAVRVDDQASFHPREYLLALAERIPGDGSYLFERTKAMEVTEGAPCTVATDSGKIFAEDAVIATHYPFVDNAFYFARMTPYFSYLLALKLDEPAPHGMFISADSRHTLRRHVLDGEELLLVGGEGHKTGHSEDTVAKYQTIEEWAQQHFAVDSVLYSWATQDYETVDQIPYIGRATPASQHLYVATGFRGWGMTNGTAAGMILSGLIAGETHAWAELFDPNRIDLDSVGKIAKQNLHVAKEFASGLVSSADKTEPSTPGQGKIVRTAWGQEAQYREEGGTLHRLSAVCPHMGCLVAWNKAEKTWDCPCHGSRFTATGQAFDGPAQHGMAPIDQGATTGSASS